MLGGFCWCNADLGFLPCCHGSPIYLLGWNWLDAAAATWPPGWPDRSLSGRCRRRVAAMTPFGLRFWIGWAPCAFPRWRAEALEPTGAWRRLALLSTPEMHCQGSSVHVPSDPLLTFVNRDNNHSNNQAATRVSRFYSSFPPSTPAPPSSPRPAPAPSSCRRCCSP